ncbi:hypothetical protein PCC7424_5010 [Gloeothece citriformis PCC 7424]|uniref:Uncharacterized protein n=1 Tax=Gloeothece citriformis (strain PCC 7424) TaxID=65393 RepID=B7KFN8_GLOC7|nr:hypothetical protein [Gloeothece citriformis]ACK73363.1 hypothetical protein PCC7424_5010 [Gloeothece citriformis PCC 7424]
MKIGLSLQLCLEDILNNLVKEEEVKYIVTSTQFSYPEDFDQFILECQEVLEPWKSIPFQEIRSLVNRLEIRQPRLINPKHYPKISDSHWVNSEAEIMWQDDSMVSQKQ